MSGSFENSGKRQVHTLEALKTMESGRHLCRNIPMWASSPTMGRIPILNNLTYIGNYENSAKNCLIWADYRPSKTESKGMMGVSVVPGRI